MREFRARKQQNSVLARFLTSPAFLVVLILFSLILIRGLYRVYTNYIETKKELLQIEENLKKSQKRSQDLNKKMEYLQSVEGKDLEIRKRLDVSAPGERVIHIIDTSEKIPENTASDSAR